MSENMLPPETLAKAQKAVDMEAEIDLHETFWTAGLYPSGALVEEFDALIKLTQELIPLVPENKDPKVLERLITRYKRKIRKYTKYRDEEEAED